MSTTHTQTPSREPPTRARLRDVAREAGVSLATASRALRGEASVREEMAERVRKAAMIVGYARPVRDGAHPRAAKKGAPEKVLVLTPASEKGGNGLPKLLEGVALTLRGAGLDPVVTEDPADLPRPSPRGVIAIHLTDEARCAELGSKVRVVNVGHAPARKRDVAGANCVVADDFGGMYAVISGALALGHRRVAVITGPSGHNSPFSYSWARKSGAALALDEAGLWRGRQVTWREAGWSMDEGYAAGQRILGSKREPTLVACSHDLQALGVVRAARERGLRIPRDLSVTGFGGLASGPGFRLTITSARVDPYAMGVVAAERLIELLSRPSGPSRTIVLPTTPVPGVTLAVPRRRALSSRA